MLISLCRFPLFLCRLFVSLSLSIPFLSVSPLSLCQFLFFLCLLFLTCFCQFFLSVYPFLSGCPTYFLYFCNVLSLYSFSFYIFPFFVSSDFSVFWHLFFFSSVTLFLINPKVLLNLLRKSLRYSKSKVFLMVRYPAEFDSTGSQTKTDLIIGGLIPRKIRSRRVSDPLMTLRPCRSVIKSIQSWSMSLTRKHSKILTGLTNTTRGVRPRFFRAFALTSTKPKKSTRCNAEPKTFTADSI